MVSIKGSDVDTCIEYCSNQRQKHKVTKVRYQDGKFGMRGTRKKKTKTTITEF